MDIMYDCYIDSNTCAKCMNSSRYAVELISNAFIANKKLLVCGNGGSCSDSDHIVAELIKTNIPCSSGGYMGFKAISLSSNNCVITSIANDSGYNLVFAQQVKALGDPEDVLLAISTSGRSENVLQALKFAKQNGLYTILLTGNINEDPPQSDCLICACGDCTEAIQEKHIKIYHSICRQVVGLCAKEMSERD